MRQVPGDRFESTWYHIGDSYYFRFNNNGANGVIYVICETRGCNVRRILRPNGNANVMEVPADEDGPLHTHEPDVEKAFTQEFKAAVMTRARYGVEGMRKIFDEESEL